MTLERLALVATICMLLTGVTVYALTGPPTPKPAASQSPTTSEIVPPVGSARPSGPARSEPPTKSEWDAAPAADVQGAAPLHCGAKMVREWLRVACDGTNDTGGKPRDVRILGGTLVDSSTGSTGIAHAAWRTSRGPVVYTAASSSLTSLVCPFLEGTDLEARFEWTDKSVSLFVTWPAGAPQPAIKGKFR